MACYSSRLAAPLTSLSSLSPSTKYFFCYLLPQELGKLQSKLLLMNTVSAKHRQIYSLPREKHGSEGKMADKHQLPHPGSLLPLSCLVSLSVRHHRDSLRNLTYTLHPKIMTDLLQVSHSLHRGHPKVLRVHCYYYISLSSPAT